MPIPPTCKHMIKSVKTNVDLVVKYLTDCQGIFRWSNTVEKWIISIKLARLINWEWDLKPEQRKHKSWFLDSDSVPVPIPKSKETTPYCPYLLEHETVRSTIAIALTSLIDNNNPPFFRWSCTMKMSHPCYVSYLVVLSDNFTHGTYISTRVKCITTQKR